jgi:ADP-ribose pyrophosphatase YjhB (NUDIX family)
MNIACALDGARQDRRAWHTTARQSEGHGFKASCKLFRLALTVAGMVQELEADNGHWRPFVTVATVVAIDARFLFVEESIRGERVLNQPAGHLEQDESLIEAAVRETAEESAWEVEVTGLIGVYQWRSPSSGREILRFTFAAEPLRHLGDRALDRGILRALWLSRDEVALGSWNLRTPLVLRSLDDFIAHPPLPVTAVQRFLAG